ncbi:restriction endonuclease [Sphingomonas colocasiae]|uniref:Restriction endonuclease n=1 Tax=Sphingomonas colocasiae TaxID=1848973 RepID=A0ABS7PIG7_9SPHN|nr:restriction endonuclease [Sphingomonas colocasiae]MBY8821094.1 restriction endonuclease [Sphingomonas colocasiae]
MTFSFDALSPADFEDLSRDLLGRQLGVHFEAFGPGRDGGVDGRHAAAGGTTILQAKHYRLSDFDALARTMRKERVAIDALTPDRYLLTTSRPLTPPAKDRLAAIIGPSLHGTADIFGNEDINGLLRKYPDVQKSHVKLWLSGSGVLERVLHAATYNFTTLTRDDIQAKLSVYAENPSFKAGRDILEAIHVLIVSGPPGVGKTTLAEMLSYAYLAEDWELIAIRSLDDAFTHIDDTKRQIFFFDDFLGRIALDARALSNQDSDLARFIGRVRRTPNARFILTTRAYIYEAARLQSEALSTRAFDVAGYVLDVGVYTRRIRARILYNHLIVAGVPEAHIQALVEHNAIKKIVDHDHYNPRIVQTLTNADRVEEIAPADYPKAFIDALDDPLSVWDKAFRTHIPSRCRHLLFAMFVSAEHGAEIEDLEEVFLPLHHTLCRHFSLSSGPKDFEESLRTLEGSFVTISNGRVSLINPSVRDYLAQYLTDGALLRAMAEGMATLRAARALYDHFKKMPEVSREDKAAFLTPLIPVAANAVNENPWKAIRDEPNRRRWLGMSYSSQVELLRGWWKTSKRQEFLDAALVVASSRDIWFSSWADGRLMPRLIASLRGAPKVEREQTTALVEALEERLIQILNVDLDLDDVQRIRAEVLPRRGHLAPRIGWTADSAAHRVIAELPNNLEHVDSESALEDYTKLVDELGPTVGATAAEIARAKDAISKRADRLRANTPEEDPLSVQGDSTIEIDWFTDEDLRNLFAPLLRSED